MDATPLALARIRRGLLVLAAIVGTAVAGYMIAGWSFLDASYMVVITVFGVGYGEVRPVEHPGLKVFTIGVILAGCSAGSLARSIALPQRCPHAFSSRWADGEAGVAFSGTRTAAPGTAALPPCGGVFLGSARTASPSAAWGLWFDLATGNAQRLWMSITGSSSGDI